MKRALAHAAATALLLMAGAAQAQTAAAPAGAPDPKLCESLKAAMAKAPQGSWPPGVYPALFWADGATPCRPVMLGGALRCEFAARQMAPANFCTHVAPPSPASSRATSAILAYTQARLVPTLQSCFAGTQPTRHARQEENMVEAGVQFAPKGQPAVRAIETNERMVLAGSRCLLNSVAIEIDARK